VPGQQSRPRGQALVAILDSTEQLLEDHALDDLSVAEIIVAARVSRTTFYAHFESKSAVIAACLERVIDQVLVAIDPFLSGVGDDPEAAIRTSLLDWIQVCEQHSALLRTCSEQWPHDERLRELWFGIVEVSTTAAATNLIADRAAGRAPAGADPAVLAACLMWAYESVVHIALTGGAEGLESPDRIVDPLAQILVGGLYGRPVSRASGGRPGGR
jgi:AcrR family transcriptional regulator